MVAFLHLPICRWWLGGYWISNLRLCLTMAAKARPTPHGITVNLVYTPPSYRRTGYATNAVARLSQLLLDEGYDDCTLFTDLANPISNRIYQKIGYRPVVDSMQYRLVAGD